MSNTDNFNYYVITEESSIFRKFYNVNDDLRQYYVEVSDELNTKLQFIIQRFEEIGMPPLEVMNMAIHIGIGRCEEITKYKFFAESFIHHGDVLKDYEKVKHQLYRFEKI